MRKNNSGSSNIFWDMDSLPLILEWLSQNAEDSVEIMFHIIREIMLNIDQSDANDVSMTMSWNTTDISSWPVS